MTRDISSGDNDCSDNSNGDSNGDADSGNSDSGDNNSNSDSGGSNSNSSRKNNNHLKPAAGKAVMAVNAALASIFLASSIQGSTESIILSAHAESIIHSVPPAESMILLAPPFESMRLSAQAESMKLCVC
jgi:hypothetical protein